MMAREPGFYWFTDRETNRPPSIAKWDGEYWYFIGSLHMTRDDELDDEDASDAKPIMDRYEIGERITPPS